MPRKKVIKISEKLGLGSNIMEGANWLMSVMALETGGTFNHLTDNGIGYIGLIQFGKDAASDLGTSQKEMLDMSRYRQLDYVEKWIERKKDNINCLTDLYLSVLLPNLTGKGQEKDHVLWTSDREAYYNNPSFHKEENEWETKSHRGKYNKKGQKIYTRGFTKEQGGGTTYMWEVTKEIERWYNKGIKQKNKCPDDNCFVKGEQTKKGYDIEKAIDYLMTKTHVKSKGKCALYVRESLNAGGIENIFGHAREYYNTQKLEGKGFTLLGDDISTIELKAGDIATFKEVKGHEYGHIQMYNGTQWISDFAQKNFWVANEYIQENKYKIYRWK